MDNVKAAAVVFFVLTLGRPMVKTLMGPAVTLFKSFGDYMASAGDLPF